MTYAAGFLASHFAGRSAACTTACSDKQQWMYRSSGPFVPCAESVDGYAQKGSLIRTACLCNMVIMNGRRLCCVVFNHEYISIPVICEGTHRKLLPTMQLQQRTHRLALTYSGFWYISHHDSFSFSHIFILTILVINRYRFHRRINSITFSLQKLYWQDSHTYTYLFK